MRSLPQALLLLSLALIGACDNKPAPKVETKPPANDPTTKLPRPVDPNQKTTPPPVTAPPIGPPTAGTGKPYLLRIKEKQGNTWNYTYDVKTFADPRGLTDDNPQKKQLPEYSDATVGGEVHMLVTAVKDGKTTYKKSATVTKSVGTGVWKKQAEDLAKNKPDIVNYTWDERMSNVNIDKGELYDVMTNSMHSLFPKEPVQVGSTWDYHPIPDAPQNSKAKFEAVEKMDGISVARIGVVFPATQPGESNSMKVWIDYSNGRIIKVQMDSIGNTNGLKAENHLVQELKR